MNTLLQLVEAHAALTQALSGSIGVLISAGLLIYTVRTLGTIKRQTDASVSMTTESFRPIVEVLGGSLREGDNPSEVSFMNKGNGAALNFRWKDNTEPEKWRSYTTNILAPGEKGQLVVPMDWRKGLVLSYNSVAHREELRTYVSFGATNNTMNSHDVRQGRAVTRMGWTISNPELTTPGWHSDFVSELPWRYRLRHWWNLKRGREHRL